MHASMGQVFTPATTAGNVFLAIAILVIIAGAIFAYYSRGGARDIAQRPRGGEMGGEPGVGEGPSRMSASEHDREEPPQQERPR